MTDHPQTPPRSKKITGMIAILLLGIAIGTVGTLGIVRSRMQKLAAGGPDSVRKVVERRLVRRLDLRQDQRSEVARILEATHERLRTVKLRNQPEVNAILKESVQQLEPVLDDKQEEKLRQIIRKLKASFGPAS
ncbi:MAG TPA: hypothetical protein DCR55_01090 [Lentisphaeria bacterium]|jgi:hypothetical protein|nr:hypothetical protein [Lentisphaeria bacterium]